MLAMAKKTTDYTHDIAFYAKDSRLAGRLMVKGMNGGK